MASDFIVCEICLFSYDFRAELPQGKNLFLPLCGCRYLSPLNVFKLFTCVSP